MTDVFISYKKEDVRRVEPIARALANAGYDVWWDHRIPPGRTYREVIGAALQSAKCVIVVWSTLSANAQWVLDEADEGKKRNVLLPLLIDDVEIPYGFRQIEAARLVGWSGDTSDSEWEGVLSAVQHFVGRAPGGAPRPLTTPSHAPPPPAASREVRSGGRQLAGPLLGVAAVAALGAGGYYAWQSGFLTPPSITPADGETTTTPPINDVTAIDTQVTNTNLPTSTRRDVQVPGDEFATYFQSGYVYCDAKLLGAFWGQGIGEAKATVGWKILNGLGQNVPAILQHARNAGHTCEWTDTGHTYSDAERLAAAWGMNDPYQAKLRTAELYTLGRSDVVLSALGGG
ncbi:MAG: toll/interleukin-1 receptor domain-containing protein [Hyphomonadaceae bacterium]|nr:toll/interleukin-1 receptor domain-containing protein [Hyphomonadaceae bacterium]MCA8885556.1 toll/interleukin-1 receptor domain-containing protein [Hyphomonadaceae bacterium]